MTEILERPALPDPIRFLDAHIHTGRCWWNVGLGGWVCPPSRREPT